MGLKNAPITFQRTMHTIFGKDEEEHGRNLDKVLQRLEDFGVAIKPKKCKIGFSKTEYMGYMIGSEGVEMLKDRAEAIRGVKVPTCKKEIQRFLGMCNYYRKFIRNFSQKTFYIRKLLVADRWRNKNAWDRKCQKEFENLKEELCSTCNGLSRHCQAIHY